MFAPRFQLTPSIVRCLMDIEASRQAVDGLPIDGEVIASLRETARLLSTHYSTRIDCLHAPRSGRCAVADGRSPGLDQR